VQTSEMQFSARNPASPERWANTTNTALKKTTLTSIATPNLCAKPERRGTQRSPEKGTSAGIRAVSQACPKAGELLYTERQSCDSLPRLSPASPCCLPAARISPPRGFLSQKRARPALFSVTVIRVRWRCALFWWGFPRARTCMYICPARCTRRLLFAMPRQTACALTRPR